MTPLTPGVSVFSLPDMLSFERDFTTGTTTCSFVLNPPLPLPLRPNAPQYISHTPDNKQHFESRCIFRLQLQCEGNQMLKLYTICVKVPNYIFGNLSVST